jgi:diaminopimelate epimerase
MPCTKLPFVKLPFTKMEALGNDFVVVNASDLGSPIEVFSLWQDSASAIAKALCDRHFGIGADGLILLVDLKNTNASGKLLHLDSYPESKNCNFGWVYTNADGSPSKMCGNGLRCLALFVHENKLLTKNTFLVATAKGPVEVSFKNANEITSDLGSPKLKSEDIPMEGPSRNPVVKETIDLGDIQFDATCVSMGNPHCVIFEAPFMDKFSEKGKRSEDGHSVMSENLSAVAQRVQKLPLFPENVNVGFGFVQKPNFLKLYVYERGSGATLACASAAAGAAVAGVLEKRLERETTIQLPGGELKVNWSELDDHVRITGPARIIFQGTINLEQISSGKIGVSKLVEAAS